MTQIFSIEKATLLSGAFTIGQAKQEDTEEILALLMETAKWLQSKGSTQWSALLSGEDSHDTAGAIRRGDVFLAKAGETAAGIVILMREPSEWDLRLWGDAASSYDRSIYLHRLAISRSYAKSGLGEAILQWSNSGILFEGKDVVRLDCIADNPTLNDLYSRNGYVKKGLTDGFNLYEKPVEL
ncbi:GNAT family N-acetyltransferase [Paenibacillus sp. YIM B09110]|uniref:GNAT family N-acetyltransferase n=1 Tax=Paenibacillus sp. YIM B09110 TaxID=3126102 RepID=UPI00301C6884